jgi:uncharacterized membrane protein YwaF
MNTYLPLVSDILFYVICFGVPVLVFLPPLKKREDMGKRVVLSTILVWVGLNLHFEFIHVDAAYVRAEARGNRDYDPAGYGAMIFFGGWIFGIFSTAVTACGYLAIQYIKRRRQEKAGGSFGKGGTNGR